eukprot:2266673-Lingulodinium_polyedra.AAC.1
MGGTHSMLLWSMAYDPIVEATQGPTFVDDLAGLTVGVEMTLRLHLFLLVVSHAAGLSVTAHSCSCVHARAVHPRMEAALKRFPVQTQRTE